jgi:hypothetical protein
MFLRDFTTGILDSKHFYILKSSSHKGTVHLRVRQYLDTPLAVEFTRLDLGWIVMERDTTSGAIAIKEVQEMQDGEGQSQYVMEVEQGREYIVVPRTNGFGMVPRIPGQP